jgi:IS5 family transposase
VIEPHYPKGMRGRPPVGLERMLRVYLVQQWYNLSDEGAEDEITDSQALRGFVGIDLSRESAPDATTLLQFRHLLEKHELTKQVFEAINGKLSAAGLMMREGTIADATILAAPPSVKNEAQARDPEMHQTKKGNQWYFGMKAHICGIMEQPPQPLGSRPGADHFFPASAFYEPSHGYIGTHDIPP